MWSSAEIDIVIDEADLPTVLASITTPIGVVELIANVRVVGDTLYLERTHIGGLNPNALGVAGLNAIGRKMLEAADVTKLVIQGGARTSGRRPGRIPRTIHFPRVGADDWLRPCRGRYRAAG
jgi:hypothetical protein